MNTEHYIESLRVKLRGLFLMLKDGHEVPVEEKRYVEGFMHASMDLGIATSSELQALMEEVNQEVFGMSIAQRRSMYKDRVMTPDSALDTPTWKRKGIKIDVGED